MAKGTPVYGSDEVEVGKVVEVLDNYREHIFDGLVVETPRRRAPLRGRPRGGPHRRARRDAQHPAAEAAALPPPEPAAAPVESAKKLFGRLRRR